MPFPKVLFLIGFVAIFIILNTLTFNATFQANKRPFEDQRVVNKETDEFTRLVQLMFQVDAFLLEVDFLNELGKEDFRKSVEISRFNAHFFKRYSQYGDSKQLTFGILNHTLSHDEIKDLFSTTSMKRNFDLNCNVKKTSGYYLNSTVTTNIYLNCTQLTIQLSVLYKRGDFLWSGADELTNSGHHPKWFGDLPRALNSFETGFINDNYSTLIQIPMNLRRFLFDYEYSVFHECNRSLLESNLKKFGDKHKQDPVRNSKIFAGMKYFKRIMDTLYKPYFLTSGTLLGWYRDCGIINHTTDADFGMFTEHYDLRIKRAFLGNRQMKLTRQFGIPEKGLEYRLHSGFFTNDLFFYYDVNSTHFYTPYHGSVTMYKQVYSKFSKLCSSELFGSKFLIPCNPVKVLIEDYGVNFTIPTDKGFKWTSMDHRLAEKFNSSVWSLTRRSYDNLGNLNLKSTLEDLNERAKEHGFETEVTVDDLY